MNSVAQPPRKGAAIGMPARIVTLLVVLSALLWPALPAVAGTACSGRLASLASFAGQYLANHNLLAAPEVVARLDRLPLDQRLQVRRFLDVSGPIQLHECHLVVTGSEPHMGGERDEMLDVDLRSGTLIAALHDQGRIDILVIGDPTAATPASGWNDLPTGMREWAVRADMGFPKQAPRSLAMPASVHIQVVSDTPSTEREPVAIKIADIEQPTAAQVAAIRRASGSDLAICQDDCFSVSSADLNDDGRPDLIVQYGDGFCGSAGCSGIIVMATRSGYSNHSIQLAIHHDIAVLSSTHHGMHDLQYDGDSPIWTWNGRDYDIRKTAPPAAMAPAWETRPAAGRTLALAVPADSTIKSVSVFCDQGKPVLAMLLKLPRARTATTFTWVFRGWSVNVSMQPANPDGTLWMADLSRSDLPEWLAHRGHDANTRELARLADLAYLRLNGAMQGQVSLKGSTAATQAALQSCYRY